MFWFFAILVIILGPPLLMMGLALLVSELGIVPVVVGGFVLLTAAGAVSLPAAVSLVITCGVCWFVYQWASKFFEVAA